MIHVHSLGGCAPAPLAHYLKALGVLRLVAEQADSDARGWWDGDHFRLASRLTIDELHEFFLSKYSPTPMFAPWNGASGFFKTWDKKKKELRRSKNFDALKKIRLNTGPRWEAFRTAWNQAENVLNSLTSEMDVSELADKERGKLLIVPGDTGPVFAVVDKDRDKTQIQAMMQHALSGVPFYRSAIINVGKDKQAYPSMWGSGGNDGAIDFTARYMENLILVLDADNDRSAGMLAAALIGAHVNGLLKGAKGKVGQFLPGGAGGANSVSGVGTQDDTLLNPWDFVLMLEGAVCFTSHVSRQSGSESSREASPFAVHACGAAYSSASADDESARGEQWMPLWSRPSSHVEIRRLLSEGRAQVGAKTAREPLDLARAVRRLGTARGINAFQRYGYIERNGQSNLAVPLGRLDVVSRPSEHVTCTDDLDLWLRRLRREARNSNAPTRLVAVEKRLVEALFTVTARPERPESWQSVLLRLSEVEETMAYGAGSAAQPVPPLRPEWVTASHDGTAEFRLALAFALQSCVYRVSGRRVEDQIRRHWLPLEPKRPQFPLDPERKLRFATVGSETGARLDLRPEVVMRGRRSVDDVIALVERRMVEASRREGRYLPLKAARGASASIADLTALLFGGVNLERVLALARALMALNHKDWAERHTPIEMPKLADWPDDAWLAIRLCVLPWPIKTRSGFELDIGTDPAIIRRLAAGDAASAISTSLRRLGAAGVRCTIRAGTASPDTARLWAAGLAFPITKAIARRFLFRLDPNKE